MKKIAWYFFMFVTINVFAQDTFYSLEEALEHPEKVKRLILKRKKIETIPKEILQLHNLEELDLTGNRLSSLPDEIQGLKKLKKLNLSRNRFHEFPGILVSMYWLQYLDLWDNEIEHVALGVEQMKGLVELELRGIQLPQQRIDSIRALLPKSKVFFSDPCDCIYNK